MTLEFFANSTSTPPSATSPAFTFLGSAQLTSAGTFSVNLPVSVGVGLLVSATATVTTVTTPPTPNDTSMFSNAFAVSNPFVVTTLSDNGSNASPLPGSLRQVIESVNDNPTGPNTISFGLGGTIMVPAGVPLPTLTVPVTIDGTTNAIVLQGNGHVADGLTLGTGSQGSVIEGLTITGFTSDGILIGSSNNTVGGTAAGAGNVIFGNTGDAVHAAAGTGNMIRQNLITFTSPAQGIVVDTGVEATTAVSAVASVGNSTSAGLTTIDGSVVNATVPGTYTVEFFASNGTGGPAAQFLGSTTVTLTAAGSKLFTASLTTSTATFDVTKPLLDTQTITATVTGPDNSTSAFATTTALPVSNPFLVSNTSDNAPGSTVGSLRLAILNANTQPAATGLDSITFKIGGSPFVITVAPGLPLPAISVPVSIQGRTSAAAAIEVEINGGGQSFDGLILGPGSGGATTGSGNTIEGLDIANFQGAAIHILTNNNVVSGNFLGTDLTGGAAGPGNLVGVLIDNASGNLVGATDPSLSNTIGFNAQNGVSVLTGTGNAIRSNTYLGKNGPATPTEASDIAVAPGANGSLAAPGLISAVNLGSNDLQVLFNSMVPPGTVVTIDAYKVVSGSSPSRTFLGTADVNVSADPVTANIATVVGVAAGDVIVATMTVVPTPAAPTNPDDGTTVFSGEATISSPATVSNTNATGTGSLAAAITAANNGGNPDIVFNIPASDLNLKILNGFFTFTINLPESTPLPMINTRVTIDGTTELAFLQQNSEENPSGALVVIQGVDPPADGFVLAAGSDGSTIEGLGITDFTDAGVLVESNRNIIGGTGTDDGNSIWANGTAGILIQPPSSPPPGIPVSGNMVLGNLIGIAPAGVVLTPPRGQAPPTPLTQLVGVLINNSSSNTIGTPIVTITSNAGGSIGATTTSAANIIGLNTSAGVSITGSGATGNVVLGNDIGVDRADQSQANGIGIVIDAAGPNKQRDRWDHNRQGQHHQRHVLQHGHKRGQRDRL